jgi:hypothetical protein
MRISHCGAILLGSLLNTPAAASQHRIDVGQTAWEDSGLICENNGSVPADRFGQRNYVEEEAVIYVPEQIASHARPVPRDWARLIQKLRWIGLDDEAARLEWAVSNLPLDQRCELYSDPADTD